jgi:serine/threonine-protein kinase
VIGEKVANYRIVAKLGEGGMGVVYLAEHQVLGKKAAVKILLPELSKNEDIVSRFFNEARAATLVKHPGIVDIFDFGHHTSGCAYIAMELLEGESLAARMKRERLPVGLSIELVRQIASALTPLHARGIVHRDLKPGNIFLVSDSAISCGIRVKLLDFGIAKLAGDTDPGLKTRTGALVGTPVYMSPEQCRGTGEVDHRADIYALGCLMYTMVAGRPPFVSQGVGDIIAAHIYQQPTPLSQIVPSVSLRAQRLVAKMLAKSPGDRQQSTAELIAELDLLDGRQPGDANIEYRRDLEVESFRERQVKTTLSQSAFELAHTPPSAHGGRKRRILISALGTAALLSAIAYVTINRRGPAPAPPITLPPSPVHVEPAARPAEAPRAERPAKVKLRVDSLPVGADVYRAADGILLGKTPFQEELARGPGQAVYILKLAGYRDYQVRLPARADGSLSAQLVAVRAKGKKAGKPEAAPLEGPAAATVSESEPSTEEAKERAARLKNDLKNPWH